MRFAAAVAEADWIMCAMHHAPTQVQGLMLIPTEEAWKGLEDTAVMQNVNLKGKRP